MSHAPHAPNCPAALDEATTALQVRAFAWYLGVVLAGLSVLWVVVPRFVASMGPVANALLPTILVFDLVCLVALLRFPRLLRVVQVAHYASFFPILLGFLALTLAQADDPAARQSAVAWFAVWIPVVVTVTFHVFGSRDGLAAALAFVAGTIAVIVAADARGAFLDAAGAAYVVTLCVASIAFAAIVYGTSVLAERLGAARLEAALAAELALRDGLTGVHTRYALEERFGQELARARREGRPLAVYFLDLDGFKAINDAHGHATGDALLRTFAGRVQGVVRASDTVGRLGGDEFVVLASVADDPEAHALADRLVASCVERVTIGGLDVALSVSIGLAMHPRDGAERDALLGAADASMYAAKVAGRNRWSAHARREQVGSSDRARADGSGRFEGGHRELSCTIPV